MKKKVLLTFPSNLTGSPVTYNLIKHHDLKINILRASIKYNVKGELLLELDGSESSISSGIRYLDDIGIRVDSINTRINRSENLCVHCGACTAVCNSEALSIDKKSWEVCFNDEKCLGCELCIKACPTKAITGSI